MASLIVIWSAAGLLVLVGQRLFGWGWFLQALANVYLDILQNLCCSPSHASLQCPLCCDGDEQRAIAVSDVILWQKMPFSVCQGMLVEVMHAAEHLQSSCLSTHDEQHFYSCDFLCTPSAIPKPNQHIMWLRCICLQHRPVPPAACPEACDVTGMCCNTCSTPYLAEPFQNSPFRVLALIRITRQAQLLLQHPESRGRPGWE